MNGHFSSRQGTPSLATLGEDKKTLVAPSQTGDTGVKTRKQEEESQCVNDG